MVLKYRLFDDDVTVVLYYKVWPWKLKMLQLIVFSYKVLTFKNIKVICITLDQSVSTTVEQHHIQKHADIVKFLDYTFQITS